MHNIALLSTTGFEQIDQSMCRMIERMELQFPGRVRGYYLVGSLAYGEAIPNSDIDMIVLFKGRPSDDERQQFEQAREECRQLLRALCQQCLGFENHFLERYKAYLLAELEHPDQAVRLFAMRRLGQVIYRDAAVAEALRAAGQRGPEELRQAVAETLNWYTERTHDVPSTDEVPE